MSAELLSHIYGDGITGTAGEKCWVIGAIQAWRGGSTPCVMLHGNGADAKTMFQSWAWGPQLADKGFLVAVPDAGGPTNWGGPTCVTRIGQALDYLATKGATGPALLVGGSMGALGAMNFAKANPTRVKAIAVVTPALSLTPFASVPELNAAYNTYVPATHNPNYSPVHYAATLRKDIPIRLWSASDDIEAPEATHCAPFVAARPQTIWTQQGAVGGHAGGQTAALPGLQKWIEQFQ